MEYKIDEEPLRNTLKIKLSKNEKIYAEPGALVSYKGNVDIKSKFPYGLRGSIGRILGGESPIINEYLSLGRTELILGSSKYQIYGIKLNKKPLFLRDGTYFAHIGDMKVGSAFGGITSIISGSGLFFQKIEGKGELYITIRNKLMVDEVKPGKEIVIDNTSFVGYEGDLNFKTELFGKTLASKLLGGEGFVIRIWGKGKIYYQVESKSHISKFIEEHIEI